jgi:integrase
LVSRTVATDASSAGDVYVDTVPGPRQRRGYTPTPRPLPSRPHDFLTPDLPTPIIERPTEWPETVQTREQIIEAVAELDDDVAERYLRRRRAGVALVLDWLSQFPGVTWQQRWLASGVDHAADRWADLVSLPGLVMRPSTRMELTGGMTRLVVLGAVRPSYNWLYRWHSPLLAPKARARRDPDGFTMLDSLCAQNSRFTLLDQRFAYMQLARMLLHNGGQLADITLADCIEAYRAEVGYTPRQHSHWYLLLLQAGILPADSPPTIHAASRRGQLTVEELVDGYGVACRPVRGLLVDYLHERQAALDYCSLRQLASKLVLLFWRDLELHEPGIDRLHLSDAVARRWKDRLHHIRYGNHRVGQVRQDPNTIFVAVRSFYTDLNHWALEDPSRWGRWAAPSPITARDLAAQNKQIRRMQARMHQRTRELAPILPTLVTTAATRCRLAAEVLATARAAPAGQAVVVDGQRLVRVSIATDPERGGKGRLGVVYAEDPDTGRRHNLTLAEDNGFWSWAIIEVLRHTGVRIEELLELTHRSLVAYTLPTTREVIPLLQITPSKTDRERLLVVSPELAEVLTSIIKRVSSDGDRVPLVSRYDEAERLHSPHLPFLFQRPWGLRNQPMTKGYARKLIDQTMAASGVTTPDGRPLAITPHDFRRIFATEAVASGLPVHIAAKLLGHESLATTQRYVAVYDRDVVEHHRAFITRRRSMRPSEEYREPTDAEWEEFLAHFEKRKVELGVCGRAYGTACIHEHACVRCPMLRPDPKQLGRLKEIQANLRARLAEAKKRMWLGEVEGLELSLAGAGHKRASMEAQLPTEPTESTA